MTEKVLLVYLDPILNPLAQPYGLSILKRELETEDIAAEIVMPFFATDPVSYLKSRLDKLRPGIVGFSLRNLDVASFHHMESVKNTFLPLLKQLVDTCRKCLNDSVVILGGSGFSVAPREILELVKADIGFIGPAEHDFVIYCKRWWTMGTKEPEQKNLVDGLSSAVLPLASKYSTTRTKDCYRTSLSSKVPYYPLESLELAKILGGTIPVRTKTGCNIRCSYCVVPLIEPLELRSMESVLTEIEHIVDTGFGDRIFFADGEFNLPNLKRALELCHEMHSNFADFIKWRCYICPSLVTEELVLSMKRAGCIWVGLTVDAYSDRSLKGLGKGHSVEQAIEATDLFLRYDIDLNVNLIFGGPEETLDTIHETLQVTKHFLQKGAHFSPIFGIRIYPNTPISEIAKRKDHEEFVSWNPGVPWLGRYSKPWPRNKLADLFIQHFPRDQRIHHAKTFGEMETDFNLCLASAFLKFLHGNMINAEHDLREIHKKYPDRIEAALALAKVLKGQGRINEAVSFLRKFV